MNFYWLSSRLSVLLILPSIILDIELNLILLNLILIHLYIGLNSILIDYIHDKRLLLYLTLLLKIIIVNILFLFIEIFF